jgi:cell division septation protein DedD
MPSHDSCQAQTTLRVERRAARQRGMEGAERAMLRAEFAEEAARCCLLALLPNVRRRVLDSVAAADDLKLVPASRPSPIPSPSPSPVRAQVAASSPVPAPTPSRASQGRASAAAAASPVPSPSPSPEPRDAPPPLIVSVASLEDNVVTAPHRHPSVVNDRYTTVT